MFCFRLQLPDFLLMLLLHDPIYGAIFFQIINKADTLFFVAVSEQFPRFPQELILSFSVDRLLNAGRCRHFA